MLAAVRVRIAQAAAPAERSECRGSESRKGSVFADDLRLGVDDLRRQMGELRERMARLEGLLEGLRESITGRHVA